MKALHIFSTLFSLDCASSSRYEVEINSIASQETSGKKFIVLSALKEVSSKNLRFQELQKIISNVLKLNGYVEAKDAKTADLAIFLYYYISDGSTPTCSPFNKIFKLVRC